MSFLLSRRITEIVARDLGMGGSYVAIIVSKVSSSNDYCNNDCSNGYSNICSNDYTAAMITAALTTAAMTTAAIKSFLLVALLVSAK